MISADTIDYFQNDDSPRECVSLSTYFFAVLARIADCATISWVICGTRDRILESARTIREVAATIRDWGRAAQQCAVCARGF